MHPNLQYPPNVELGGALIQSAVLYGKRVQLEPLNHVHVDQLAIAADDPQIWGYLFDGSIYHQWGLPTLVFHLLECQRRGTDLPFAVIDRPTGFAVGITRYLHIDRQNKRLEIASWYSTGLHKTGVNTESKFLILRHAFEILGFNRVQFEIDVRNKDSLDSISKLGAKLESKGLRKAHILSDGSERTSALYSITDEDWKRKVKAQILNKMQKYEQSQEDQRNIEKQVHTLGLLKKMMEDRAAAQEKYREALQKSADNGKATSIANRKQSKRSPIGRKSTQNRGEGG